MDFVLGGKFVLPDNPYRKAVDTMSDALKEIERHRSCKHAYCLKCRHVQSGGFDVVFVCGECGWLVGEAIP
jgi:hypothetical protein